MTGDRSNLPGDEDRLVREMTDELEALMAGPAVAPEDGFTDRVMASIAGEPLPQPVRAFTLALLGGRLRAAGSSLGDAWRVATSGFAPAVVRAQALALVLAVSVATIALAGGATVGAMNLLTPPATPSNPTPSPSPTPSTSPSPSPSAEPTDGASPTETIEPSETPEPTATDDHGGRTASPTATGTDDRGGGSGSGDSGGGGSGSGSDGGGSGKQGTPEPTESDDHGGGGSDG